MLFATKKDRREFLRVWKLYDGERVRVAQVHHTINNRAGYKRRIEEVQVNGWFGIHTSGMDCDCSAYERTGNHRVPKSIVEFVHAEEVRQQWLDGPERRYIVAPFKQDELFSKSRDLALEAYEDGHPHQIVWPASL